MRPRAEPCALGAGREQGGGRGPGDREAAGLPGLLTRTLRVLLAVKPEGPQALGGASPPPAPAHPGARGQGERVEEGREER